MLSFLPPKNYVYSKHFGLYIFTKDLVAKVILHKMSKDQSVLFFLPPKNYVYSKHFGLYILTKDLVAKVKFHKMSKDQSVLFFAGNLV